VKFQYSHFYGECPLHANVQCIQFIEERPVVATALSFTIDPQPPNPNAAATQPKMVHAAAAKKLVGHRRESVAIEKRRRRRRTFCGSLVFSTYV